MLYGDLKFMLKFFRKLLILTGIMLAVIAFTETAEACDCRLPPTVDRVFAAHENVVVLKLQSIIENENAPHDYLLSVKKVFKGDFKVDQILTFTVGSMCDFYFSEEQIGAEFLFYLNKSPENGGKWIVSRCSRSGEIGARAADLRFLENEKKLRGKTRLSGNLEKLEETPGEPEQRSWIPLADRKVRVTGNGKNITLRTDRNGDFEIYDLPPGQYRVTPEKLDGYSFSSDKTGFEEIEIKSKSHTEMNFLFSIDNEISGKVVSPKGNPLEQVCVELLSVKTREPLGVLQQSCTDEKGEFEISSIPAGTYLIAVNLEDKITTQPLFRTFYYPNVKNIEQAAEISVSPNFTLKNLVLIPQETLETITIGGTLIFSDGKPAADVRINFFTKDELSKSEEPTLITDFSALSDENGRFSLDLPKGKTGALRATFYAAAGEFEDCPAIEESLKLKNSMLVQFETNLLEIDTDKDLAGIELKFPLPSCKKAK